MKLFDKKLSNHPHFVQNDPIACFQCGQKRAVPPRKLPPRPLFNGEVLPEKVRSVLWTTELCVEWPWDWKCTFGWGWSVLWTNRSGVSITIAKYWIVDDGAAERGGGSKKVESNGNLKKKIVTNCACFCSATMLSSTIITDVIESHSEFSGCANNCNQFIWSQPLIYLWYCYEKALLTSLPPPWKGRGQCPGSPMSLVWTFVVFAQSGLNESCQCQNEKISQDWKRVRHNRLLI